MAVALGDLDAHEAPSDELRAEWKAFTRLDPKEALADPRVDDPRLPLSETEFKGAGSISKTQIQEAFAHVGMDLPVEHDAPIIHHPLLPGLLIIPDLVPPPVQTKLVDLMVHRDLSNPKHTTNMHLFHNIPYPSSPSSSSRSGPSFFTLPPDDPSHNFTPKDPSVHKYLTPRQVLNKRLHWVTLGGQYDWTNRVYPDEEPPQFPEDIGGFLEALFPKTLAQAAIVNFYSPGDTMMMHRDVSEEANRGLISLSLGCDGLFMIAPSKVSAGDEDPATGGKGPGGKNYMILRLRSGDAIYMSEESRYAWHGVPKVVKGTCPEFMEEWPATEEGQYEGWRGWMKNKRINLNVRQMKE